jgi:F0F1-type ATP synthase assembly protein I
MKDGERLRKARKGYEGYLRFAGMGLTMMGIVLVSAFAGWWLDRQLRWPIPAFTLVLSLLGIAGAMVYLFKETGRK